jgi:CRISPR-associated endonuclease/helicase Cas3
VKVHGYTLSQVEIAGVRLRLYPHQAAVLNEWDNRDALVLVTKTGSGKTRAVALPVLKRHEAAVFVYPTNALIADQAASLQQLMDDEGVTYREWTPETANHKSGDEEYALVQVNAETLEEFRKVWRMAHKGDALLRLLRQDKRKLVLVNPDILYLVFALRYGRTSAEAIAHLQAYTTVVFDEFHLYNGVELAHALFMIQLARQIGTFKRVVLLSATPNPEVRLYLCALLKPMEVDANVSVPESIVGERTVAHDVQLLPLPTSHSDVVETAREKVLELVSELRKLQADNMEANACGRYVPCVVILNSVVNAIALEDALVDAGIARDGISPIRGLSARGTRDVRAKLLVIGTSAIEVGIDFEADYLIFEAGDATSFMQRFGRIGRHRQGQAILLCPYREAAALQALGDEISRDTLERNISAIYPQQNPRAWFISTFGGMITVCAQAYNFKLMVTDDRSADDAMKERINQWMDGTLADYARMLGVERIFLQTQRKLKSDWFAHYCEINTFRTSLPSQKVWDVSEKERGREWSYQADVKTLLARAERLWFNDKHQRLYVTGYRARHHVWFAKSFDDQPDLVGTIQTTAHYSYDEMQFIQDGHLTSVSHVMNRPKHHIFVFAPIELANELDWRIAWFSCGAKGRYIIAFDGDALLLKEIYDRWKQFPTEGETLIESSCMNLGPDHRSSAPLVDLSSDLVLRFQDHGGMRKTQQ